jgi:hypothetical protein
LKEIWLDFIHVLEFQAAMASINAIGCVRVCINVQPESCSS